MDYPIIYVKQESASYKHCAKAIALLIDIQASDTYMLDDPTCKKAYLENVIAKMQESIANMFVVSQGSVLFDQEQCFSVYKGNLEKQAMLPFMAGMVKELYEYTNQQVQVKYAFSPVMLLVENKAPSMFSAAKVGLPIMKCSMEWQTINVEKARSMGKYLSTFEEFQSTSDTPQFDYYI